MLSPALDIADGSCDAILAPSAATLSVEVSVVMPCLNEAETLGRCIAKARRALDEHCLRGEIIVADNGSTDGSQQIAVSLGAKVVPVAAKGYGNAVRAGIAAACGEYVVFGDADDSYDFGDVPRFVDTLRDGYDLVMGNRFQGGILPGAMPWKHRYLGNPVLTGIGRLFFHSPVGDFHCGFRGFRKGAIDGLDLCTPGMEFASEMVIKATLHRLKITEIPVVLHPDGRSRPPHLRSWRDGWRHLRFMLLFSPLWLFCIPGLLLLGSGGLLMLALAVTPLTLGPAVLDIHTMLVAGLLAVIGQQLVVFAAFTQRFAIQEGWRPASRFWNGMARHVGLEWGVVVGVLFGVWGFGLLAASVWHWQQAGFGPLDPRVTMRQVVPAVTLLALGVQTVFASFFLGILGMKGDRS